MEVVWERKLAKLVKTWAPVLLLMGVLIAVDTFDSPAGQNVLSVVQHSIGFGTDGYHLQPLPNNNNNKGMSEKHVKTSKQRKGRRLLQPQLPPVPQFKPGLQPLDSGQQAAV